MDSVSEASNATPRPLLQLRFLRRHERVASPVVPDVAELEPGFDDLISVFFAEAIRIFFGVSWYIGDSICIDVKSVQLLFMEDCRES